MLDLELELDALVAALNKEQIPYAVCGGIAMAIHGFTRATEDIDLFVRPEDLERVEKTVAGLGFLFRALPMQLSSGKMQIRRVTKVDSADGDLLVLDLLLVTPLTEEAWSSRQSLTWRGRPFPVVSREGLILLKRFRSSDQDLVDIKHLENE